METKPSSRVVPGFLCVAAGLLLLAAACTSGTDNGPGTSPAATPAPAATATAAPTPTTATHGDTAATITAARAAATTVAAAAGTSIETPAPTTSSPTPGTANTPTGTTGAPTPTTAAPIPPTTTGPATSTTGPPVTTTAPNDTTDDTTTSTTEADDGDGSEHEPRNDVDRKYPIGSTQRQAYLNASGGVAPAGATVTFDAGDAEFPIGLGQRGRATADRWPNGYPAAPRSPDYSSTTFAQREAQRAARWVAAMERGGHYRWWVSGVPKDPDEPFLLRYNREPAPVELHALREYQTPERYNDLPPADLIWALPRIQICLSVANVKASKHAGTGSETLPCEVVTDWVLWWVEEFTSPSVISLPWYDRLYTVFHREASLLMQALAQPPTHPAAVSVAMAGSDSLLVYSGGVQTALGWVYTPLDADVKDTNRARPDVERHFWGEVQAGRRPWESVP